VQAIPCVSMWAWGMALGRCYAMAGHNSGESPVETQGCVVASEANMNARNGVGLGSAHVTV